MLYKLLSSYFSKFYTVIMLDLFTVVVVFAVHNFWICLHSFILCVGEIHWGAWNQEFVQKGVG